MSQEKIKVEICQHALEVCNNNRNVMLPQIFESIENQLNWLIAYFKGESCDRQKLFELTFGHFAAREIDPREKEVVEALNRAFYVAERTRQGLKLDLNVLRIDS
ncbi:immunity protein Tsi6 family protein [Paraferrimonas sp. SM1919]|uniref:immunity protein Tsi6 family protein n=1 Tax=Paraferrimonas sp. SM1919 TaxID=2662263 RepID=UPI0013D0EB85|nr:immunity protein Tsi6 family protein [Paraferrimonas sp. SM1919]